MVVFYRLSGAFYCNQVALKDSYPDGPILVEGSYHYGAISGGFVIGKKEDVGECVSLISQLLRLTPVGGQSGNPCLENEWSLFSCAYHNLREYCRSV